VDKIQAQSVGEPAPDRTLARSGHADDHDRACPEGRFQLGYRAVPPVVFRCAHSLSSRKPIGAEPTPTCVWSNGGLPVFSKPVTTHGNHDANRILPCRVSCDFSLSSESSPP